jgi:hypothetical protein
MTNLRQLIYDLHQGSRYVNLFILCMAFWIHMDGWMVILCSTRKHTLILLVTIEPYECLYCLLFTSWFHDISTGYVQQKRALNCFYDCNIE